MDRARVTAVIVSHNTRDLLLQSIESVVQHGGNSVEVVVVDNASADQSVEAVRENFPAVRIIANSENQGFASACNQGIESTASEYVLLLNSDAQLTPNALAILVDCLDVVPRCGAVGCVVRTPDGQVAITTRHFLTPFNQALELLLPFDGGQAKSSRRSYSPRLDPNGRDCSVDWIEASCLLVRREALDQTGLFDERYFMYSEDEDLCYRLKAAGWLVCYTAGCTVVHLGGGSSASYGVQMLQHFYSSQMRFLLKWRGRSALSFYLLAMRSVLLLKRMFVGNGASGKQARDRLDAFRQARSVMRDARD